MMMMMTLMMMMVVVVVVVKRWLKLIFLNMMRCDVVLRS